MKRSEPKESGTRFGAKLTLARLALAWERLWPITWPPVAVAAVFCSLALLDVFPAINGWVHGLALIAFAGVFVFLLWRAFQQFSWPQNMAARRRVETASGLDHRPLTAIKDTLVSGKDTPDSADLWQLHQKRMAVAAQSLRVGMPEPGLARKDPLALRAALALLLVIAITAGWSDPADRLARAVVPTIGDISKPTQLALDLWITPPEYTGKPPLFPLRSPATNNAENVPATVSSQEILEVPAGSVLTAQIQGARDTNPRLITVNKQTPFKKVDSAYSRIVYKISADGEHIVASGDDELARMNIKVIPDSPPEITFSDKPAPTPQATLRLSYKATDDYGVKQARLEIRRVYERGAVTGLAVHKIDLPLPALSAKRVNETTFLDLAPHKWAGLPVIIKMIAVDGQKQIGLAEPLKMTLPERVFNHPVARAIIEQRRKLSEQPELRGRVLRGLAGIASVPGNFNHDSVVYLSLASSRSRLIHDQTDAAIDPVVELLWDTALRIEDGRLSVAERNLRRIQNALMKALAEGASDKELDRLMRELRRAISRFLQAMREQMRRNPNGQKAAEFDPKTMRMFRTEDLARMLNQIRDLMRSGSRQAARELLARLQQMLQGMRSMQVMRQRGGRGGRQGGTLRQLQRLIQRQQQLMERTFRGSRQGQRQGRAPSAAEQQAIRDALQKLRGMMPGRRPGQQPGQGQGPGQALDRADRAMGNATRSLEGGRPVDAVGSQSQALDALRRAGRGIMQQMMDRFARQSGQRRSRGNQQNQPRRDPLGREIMGEDVDTGDISIPDASSIQRAREILDELRRRSGEGFRPKLELDYIERLLQRF
ncbi:MAG: TIGR02302 family protein [Alphaproteobacteria bacterium]|nr:TIGR02302 family protein [Alphaproteobacteria bacterium]